jgi:hypothetical protein
MLSLFKHLVFQKKSVPVCESARKQHNSTQHSGSSNFLDSAHVMNSTQAQKRNAADSINSLLAPGVLQIMLSYVGPGHHLFMAPISKSWKDMYAAVNSQQLTVFDERSRDRIITRVPQMTLYSAVFASPARVKLAHDVGLDCTSKACQRTAGKHADVATLAAAYEVGMDYTATTMAAAFHCNRLAVVQFLHGQGCPWPSGLLDGLAKDGFCELVRWCCEHGCPFERQVGVVPCSSER